MLVLDVDGILTDCKIWLDSDGQWKRYFSIRDGVAIKALIDSGYKVGIITGSKAEDIRARVKVLGIQYFYEGALDKIPSFEDLIQKSGVSANEIAYMGDDYFDAPILKRVGFAATVSDAMPEAIQASHYIASRPAGNGAVREVADLILKNGFLSNKDSKNEI